MSLVAGIRLGPYKIESAIGAGGMGEVYKARDTRLDRTVAIKVLPAELSADPDRRARFEREAKTIAGLSHPHICTLHDVGEHNGSTYLVMEHLQGETLAQRLEKGRLPLDQALTVATEIAEALAAAHKQGIIHRDLKPGNVMLTKAGTKLLDFGLAKLRASGVAGISVESALPTQAPPATAKGTILGTLAYMAPEQLEGRETDARSDLFSFGAVIYEMLTGRRAFDGAGPASVISAIMVSQPAPLSSLEPMTPPALERLVKVCLAKDPDERLQTAHDVMLELKWITEAGSGAGRSVTTRRGGAWLSWSLVGTLGLALAGMATAYVWRAPEPARVIRFDVHPLEGTELQLYMAASPDGTRLVFTARGADGLDRLYLRSLESGESEPVAGTDGALEPFWSPDGRSLGFFAHGKLQRVELDGRAPQTICSIPELRGATWNRNGVILFGTGGAYGLHRVASSGGTPEPVSQPDNARGETSHRWPCFLADGRRFLYVALAAGGGSISVGSLDGQKPTRLIDVISAPTYAAPGRILFVRDGALRAQGFDEANARMLGEAITLAEPVQLDSGMWGGAPVSVAGTLLAYRRGDITTRQLTWFDRQGRELGSVGPPRDYMEPTLSPTGDRLVLSVHESRQLAVVDLGNGAIAPLTFKNEFVTQPCWAPDGRSIAYGSNRSGMFDIVLISASGGGVEQTLVHGGTTNWCDGFSPDGNFLLYESSDPKTQFDLWVVPLSGDRTPRPFLRTGATETHSSFSPDGRWVAYTSDASGRAEVYVRAFPSGEGPWQVSTEGGDQAQWRSDGSELFYVSPDRRLMVSAVNGKAPAFKASVPESLFRVRTRSPGIVAIRNDYVVSQDGQRFLVNKLVEDPSKAAVTVVVNWTEGLKK